MTADWALFTQINQITVKISLILYAWKMDFFNLLRLCFLVITLYISSIDGQDTCAKQGPCTCVFPNGTGIDLKPVSTSTFYSAQMYKNDGKELGLSTYYYHPCYDTILPINSTSPEDSCNKNLTVSQNCITIHAIWFGY